MSATPVIRPAARGALYALSFGHGSADLCNSAVSALLPYLVKERLYSLTAIGLFVLAASVGAGLLQPFFGWRIMWFLNLPTGLILIALSPLIPESARFLQHMGRIDEARATLARFGAVIARKPDRELPEAIGSVAKKASARHGSLLATTIALTLAALAWGFVNFGVLLWLPSSLVAEGRSVGLASKLIARSTLIAAPTVLVTAWLYSSWSTKKSLLTAIAVTTLGLLGILLRSIGAVAFLDNPIVSLSLLMVGSTAVISILLPYAAENYPIRVRGRATGWVAGWSKVGGLIAQGLSALALVPAIGVAAAVVAVPALVSLLLVAVAGRETRGHDLRDLEARPVDPATAAARS